MRAAKGPFHATIWEQPLTLGDGPMGASHVSLVVSWHESGPIHHSGFGGGVTRGTVWPCASGWSVQFNICMRDSGRAAVYEAAPVCVYVSVCVCPGGFGAKVLHCCCLASEWVYNITPLIKRCSD